jgi:hemerythrin-like metal-binding protein
MERIRWDDRISVNNFEIDNQHKYLIQLVNTLILNSNAKVNSAIIGESLQNLLKYTKEHFHDEEILLDRHNYPKLEEHKKEHKKFVLEIAGFCKDVLHGKSTITEEMISFLVYWFLNHTSVNDQDYKSYIQSEN